MKTIFVQVAIGVLGLLYLGVGALAADSVVASSTGNAPIIGTAPEMNRVDAAPPSRRPAAGSNNPETEYRVGPQDLIEVSVYALR